MDLAEMLAESLGESSSKERNGVHLLNEAAQAWREKFVPIKDLKPGDKVRWKSGCKDKRHGGYGDVLEVFSVVNPPLGPGLGENGSNHLMDIIDFTMATWDNKYGFYLYGFDSRRFERVE